jgi:hypothetical protein
MEQSFFKDRRHKDRRQRNQIDNKPTSGCRRGGCRRNRLAATDPKPWWLKVSYSEEVSAAVVRSNQRPRLYKNTSENSDNNKDKRSLNQP